MDLTTTTIVTAIFADLGCFFLSESRMPAGFVFFFFCFCFVLVLRYDDKRAETLGMYFVLALVSCYITFGPDVRSDTDLRAHVS